ncbi:hypothetical protein [Streptomyces mirabilis]|uniref:hypothetical protein n=1 Tax=Streptomyces mirabilis TaxID=68239 RepID=UPI0036B80611
MIRRLIERLGDRLHALRWSFYWRLGRTPGRLAVISLTCQRCGANVLSTLAGASSELRRHDKSHALLNRLEAEGGIRDIDIDELLEADGD